MYHQIKNVIGVNPSFYEYLFMVDADTTVDPLSLNRLISAYVYFLVLLIIYLTNKLGSMIHDKKLLGVCGETELANAKQSLITMMQVRAWKFCLILTCHLIYWFRSTNTSSLTTWRRHSKVFSGLLPVYQVVSRSTDCERLIPTNLC